MATGFAAVLLKARTIIAALVPQSTGDAQAPRFVVVDGLLGLDGEPDAISDRRFEVTADGVGQTAERLGPDERQVQKRLTVRVRYDSRHHLASLETRMAEDEEQIIDALESSANYAAGVQRVSMVDGDLSRDNPHFPTLRLTFEVLYVRDVF